MAQEGAVHNAKLRLELAEGRDTVSTVMPHSTPH